LTINQDTAKFEWVDLAREILAAGITTIMRLHKDGELVIDICHPMEDKTYLDMVVVGRRDKNAAHYQIMQVFC
jgi:hypothetical protein